MATLCTCEEDAKIEAANAQQNYPLNGPYRAAQMVDAWDTVSGEPQNWWCDEAGTATVEMTDIVERLLAGAGGGKHWMGLHEEAAAEITRLHGALTWTQHRAERIGTHAPGCFAWGPSHYECALRELEQMREQMAADRKQALRWRDAAKPNVGDERRAKACAARFRTSARLAGVNYLDRPATTILAGWKRGMNSL